MYKNILSSTTCAFRKHLVWLATAIVLGACGGGQEAAAPPQAARLLAGTAAAATLHAAADYTDAVQAMYVAYFGRPADPGGLEYFANQLASANAPVRAADISAALTPGSKFLPILNVFADSQESTEMYAGDNSLFLDAVYQNLLNRAPDQAGKAYWTKLLNAGAMTRSTAAMQIMAGAQGTDALIIANKISFAKSFTSALADARTRAAYDGMLANAVVRSKMAQVDVAAGAGFAQVIADTISGLASQQPILYGKVTVGPVARALVVAYSIVNGVKGPVINTAYTDFRGMYYMTVPVQRNPVLIVASDGSYTDPATGAPMSLGSTSLQSALPQLSGNTVATVSAFSNATVLKAASSGGLTSTSITNATSSVAQQLGMNPVGTIAADNRSVTKSDSTAAAVQYAALVGTVAQFQYEEAQANHPADLVSVLSVVADLIKAGTFPLDANMAIAANNYSAKSQASAGFGTQFAEGKIMTCVEHWMFEILLPVCKQAPTLVCRSPLVPVNGVCKSPSSTSNPPPTTPNPPSTSPPSSPQNPPPSSPSSPPANWNSSAGAEEIFSETTTLQARQRQILQTFTISSATMAAELIFVTQFTGNVFVMPASEAQKFANGGSYQYYPALSMPAGQFGFKSIDLAIGAYAVGVENTSSSSNTMRVELQQRPTVAGFHYRQDRFAAVAQSFAPGARFTQPVTISDTAYRTIIDGANTGGSVYLIPNSEVNNFLAGRTFQYYTNHDCGSGTAAPGFCELRYPAGTYVIAYVNDTSQAQAIVFYGRDYVPD
jgi:hypothetical protein